MRLSASVAEVSAVTHIGPCVMISATVVALAWITHVSGVKLFYPLPLFSLSLTWHQAIRLQLDMRDLWPMQHTNNMNQPVDIDS